MSLLFFIFLTGADSMISLVMSLFLRPARSRQRLGVFSLHCSLPGFSHQLVVHALGGMGPYVCLCLLPRSDEVACGHCPHTSVVSVDARLLPIGAFLRGDNVVGGVEQLVVVFLRSFHGVVCLC